jgi:IS30 family transposase
MKRYTHLSCEERTIIAHYDNLGLPLSCLAKKIGRSKSTLSRELKRNRNKTGYNPDTAGRRYLVRRQRASKIDKDLALQTYVIDRLTEGFSPETIALRLKIAGHLEGLDSCSFETIYRWLYKPQQKKEKLYRLLTRAHAKRGRRKRVHRGIIKDRISIHDRPAEINARKEIGHWEGDLVSFKGNRQHLLVLHERKTRYTATFKLTSKTADETIHAILSFMQSLPKYLRKSITFDNGSEFARHQKLKQRLNMNVYFCDVYASWQKGGIENMNGRLRRDLPRKTDLSLLPCNELEQIVLTHNLMPRKVLGEHSPLEVLAKHFGRSILFLFNRTVALR